MNDLDTMDLAAGLTDIPFGCTIEHVIEQLGEPDTTETDEDGDTTFEYEELCLTFFFWKDDNNTLGSIGTERVGSKLLDKPLMGESREVLVDFIGRNFPEGITEEDSCVHEDGHIQSWIEVASMGITFWFDDGFLYLMDWTGEIVPDEQPSAADDTEAPQAVPAESTPQPEAVVAEVEAESFVFVASPNTTELMPIADDLLECWDSCYPDAPPIGFMLKREYPTLWMRIHSLPNAKRWPTEEDEWQILLERHYLCASEVLKEGSECAVLVIAPEGTKAEEVSKQAALGGEFRDLGLLNEALWAKKKGVFKEPMCLFALGIKWATGAHSPFLQAVAENKVKALVVELEDGCVYAPYDGGADLFYDTEEDRDGAIKRHADWLPPRNPKKTI